MSNRDFAKTQIDALPDSAIDKVTDFISYLFFSLGVTGSRVDSAKQKKTNTWDKLDVVVSQMDELPCLEDFLRCDIGRGLISIEEV
ncbi:MAG: hypothetical protein LBC73_04955 [Oscillospiraceae bacterium]|jgi:hypothetical protein|nr:hypothetical protein [Oscillospiraceae bacterium]